MDDLVYRKELIDALYEADAVTMQGVKIINQFPAVNAVPVVRCRECKYHNKPPCPMRLSFNWTEDDDFCSYGERKDSDGNG